MSDTIHSRKTSQSPEQGYFRLGKIPEDGQITVADTGWSEETKERMRQAGYDDMGHDPGVVRLKKIPLCSSRRHGYLWSAFPCDASQKSARCLFSYCRTQ